MSDARLRELERRWRETGAVDDEAAYLLERVRSGDLDSRRLHAAADCGHAAACAALGREPSQDAGWQEVRRVLRHAGRALALRVSATVARMAIERATQFRNTVIGQHVLDTLHGWEQADAIETPGFLSTDLPFQAGQPPAEAAAVNAAAQVAYINDGDSHFFNRAGMAMRAAVAAGVPEQAANEAATSVVIAWALGSTSADADPAS